VRHGHFAPMDAVFQSTTAHRTRLPVEVDASRKRATTPPVQRWQFFQRGGVRPENRFETAAKTAGGCGSALRYAAAFLLLNCGAPAPNVEPETTSANTPPAACEPGYMPMVGGDCVEVAPQALIPGFARAPSGWGQVALRPSARCGPAEVALLGQVTCSPIDDCSAAFPPPGAQILVTSDAAASPSGSTFGDLALALAAAKAGDTIALDSGTYVGSFSLNKSVTLVGRCASQVIIEAPMAGADGGLLIDAPAKVSLRSLTIAGFRRGAILAGKRGTQLRLDRVVLRGNRGGVYVGNDAMLTATHSLIEGPDPGVAYHDTIGVFASYGAKATLDAVEFRGLQTALAAQDPGTSITMRRSVIGFEETPTDVSAVITDFAGAEISIAESYVSARRGRIIGLGAAIPGSAANASNIPARLRIERSELIHDGVPRENGSAIDVIAGATLELDGVSVTHDAFAAIGASGSTARVRRSIIRPSRPSASARSAVVATDRSTIDIDSVAVLDAIQVGLFADRGTTLTVSHALIARTLEVSRRVPDFVISGTGQAIALQNESRLQLDDSALVGNQGTGIFADRGARMRIRGLNVDGMLQAPTGNTSIGLVSINSEVLVEASSVKRSNIAFAFTGGRGMLRASRVQDAAVGLQLEARVEFKESDEAFDTLATDRIVSFNNTFVRTPLMVQRRKLASN
jgi:hypothetical protein